MINIQKYLDFWGDDLLTIKISREIEEALPSAAILFLHQYGLPTIERIYKERKTYLEFTTPLPEIILSKNNMAGLTQASSEPQVNEVVDVNNLKRVRV